MPPGVRPPGIPRDRPIRSCREWTCAGAGRDWRPEARGCSRLGAPLLAPPSWRLPDIRVKVDMRLDVSILRPCRFRSGLQLVELRSGAWPVFANLPQDAIEI